MKLSVCIFTYNHEHFIGEAIESVLSQNTSFDFEIIIGEDCSSDNTREIINDYISRYPDKIKATFNPRNLGMMKNNAATILRATGEYVALLDGDDYWTDSNKLQTQVDYLDTHQDYVLTFHDGNILSPQGELTGKTCCGGYKQKIDFTFTDVICDTHIPTFSIVFRRSALKGYPPSWFYGLNAPDRPLFLLLSSSGKGHFFKECWGVYRKHEGGCWTGQPYQSQWLTHLQIYRVLDRHFNFKHRVAFCRCENKVNLILAMSLLKDDRLQRSLCYFRKYIRTAKFFPPQRQLHQHVWTFISMYTRKRLKRKQAITRTEETK